MISFISIVRYIIYGLIEDFITKVEMSRRRTALWQQIKDGIFWGAVGIAMGFAYHCLWIVDGRS